MPTAVAKTKQNLVPPPKPKQLTPLEVILEADREAQRENVRIIRSALQAAVLDEPYDAVDVAAALRDSNRDARFWDGYCALAKQWAGYRTDREMDELIAKASAAREVAGREEKAAQESLGAAITKSQAARAVWSNLMAERQQKNQLRSWNSLICGSEDEALAAKPGPAVSLREIQNLEHGGARPY
jgi:hypothetical protein